MPRVARTHLTAVVRPVERSAVFRRAECRISKSVSFPFKCLLGNCIGRKRVPFMFAQRAYRAPLGRHSRHAVLLASLLALSVFASVLVATRAAATAQPSVGFVEAAGNEAFQVMGGNWAVQANLTFQRTDMIRVNVTSAVVDWLGHAAGGGTRNVVLAHFDGMPVATVLLTQVTTVAPFRYATSIDLSTLAIQPDWYYLKVLIADTVNSFASGSVVQVGSLPAPHSIETYTDDTFTHPSDVFTPTSVVWVKFVGVAALDPDRWNLAEFLNGNSVVGGPNAGLPNFVRFGATYTFSVDLSPWSLNFTNGWSYTLDVRMIGGSEWTKQIQIFSPSITVSSVNLAPARAYQGQTRVPMLYVTLSLDSPWPTTLGPASFNLDRLRITRTGTGANADIAGVHIYQDANNNGILDSADPLLASSTSLVGVPFPVWVGQAGTGMAVVGSTAPLHVIVAYDIAPAAFIGNRDGAQIASGADVDVPGTFLAINGLPASSGNVQIAGSTVLTVTNNPAIAPGGAVLGQPNVPMDLLHLTTNGGTLSVTGIVVSLAGTGNPADVAAVSLHVDNGNRIYDPATDPLLGRATIFSPAGTASFSGFTLAVDSIGRDVWIVYNISATATVGDTVGSFLLDNRSVVVSAGFVFGGTFPLASGLTMIAGPTLTVAWKSLAPFQARQGRTNLPMLELDLSVDFGQSTVSGLRIDKRGTSTLGSDVPLAKVWLDANADGLFDSGDLLLGSQGFVGGTTVIGGLSLLVTAGQPRTLFITYDISATATIGVTVSARLATPAYVSVDPATTVSGRNFPIASAATLITAPGPGAFLTIGSVDMAVWSPRVYAGQMNVPMEKLFLTVDANSGTVTGMRVDKTGTSLVDSDVAALKLYRDAIGNGNFSAADTLLASTSFVGGIAIFANLNIVVPVNQPVTLFLVIDLSRTATLGRTVAVHLGNHAYVVGNSTTTVDPNSFPIDSSAVTIYAGSLSGVVRDASGSPVANATVVLPQLNRTTTTGANGAYTFGNMPVGSWYVVVHAPGFVDGNQTANLTPTNPDAVVNFALSPVPNGGIPPGLLLVIGIGGGLLALIAISGFVLLLRRQSRCPVCGKLKARDQEVCPECMAKGLHPPGATLPAPPPPPPMEP